MSINTGIPVGYPVNTVVPGNTVMANPNAQVVSNSNVQMYSINVNTGEGTPVSGGYASPGNPLKILEIFEGWLLVLVPINADNTEWVIGFFETSTLPYSIEVYENTITWNNANDKTVYNSNGDVMCSLSATATIQYLYTTPDGNYACILFDGANGLATGYVSTSEGSFNITQTVPASTQLQPPTISNSGSGSSSNNTPAPSSSQPSGAIDTGIPTGSANTVVSGTTVMSNYNAQVVSNSNVQMYTSDGSAVQYGYASPGNPLKVLGIEDNGLVLTLVPINDANTEWVIGYFEQSTLQDYSIAFYENTVTWNNSSDISVYDANGNFYYSLGATQNVQYLYTTPDGNYACVLFNNNNISGEPLRTGYVSKDTGTFNRTQTVEPRNFNTEPTIANGGGSSSNNTPTPSISLPHPKGTNAAATQIYNLCIAAGWSAEATCGMLGNLSVESYLNPTEGQLDGYGYGLAQWNPGYLEEYAQEAGVSDYNTIPGQIAIIVYQMNNNGGGQYIYRQSTPANYWIEPSDFITSTQDVSTLALAWMYSYEDPSVPHATERQQSAEYWYDYLA